MEFRVSGDWRGRQTRGYSTFKAGVPLYPRADKDEFDRLFPDTSILHSIRNLDNPLQKNLGDSFNMDRTSGAAASANAFRSERYGLGTVNTKQSLNQVSQPPESGRKSDFFPALFGITNFITGFFNNITGVMSFHQARPPTPEKESQAAHTSTAPQDIFYDSEPKDSGFDESDYDCDAPADASPPIDEVDAIRSFSRRDCSKNNAEANQNKTHSVRAQCDARGGGGADIGSRGTPAADAMDQALVADPAENCRGKMARIQDLLAGKTSETPRSPTKTATCASLRYRPRPRKVFVEPKAVKVETAAPFEPEHLARTESLVVTDFVSPGVIAESAMLQAETLPKVKIVTETEGPARPAESMDIAITTAHTTDVKDEVKDKSVAENVTETEVSAAESPVPDKRCVSDEKNFIDGSARGLRGNATPSKPAEKTEIITSCEDKVNRLKALLSERKKARASLKSQEPQKPDETAQKPTEKPVVEILPPKLTSKPSNTLDRPQKPIERPENPVESINNSPETAHVEIDDAPVPEFAQKVDTRRSPDRAIPVPIRRLHGKHHKNPNRLDARKQKRKQLRRNIDEDLCFARDVDADLPSSVEGESPRIVVTPPKPESNGFDEVRGRFESNSESDESFVIVFSDSPASPPASPRSRIPSDTGSEDSFIICFEDEEGSAAGCFTGEDVFDSDSDVDDSDSDCESNLASCGNFSRTVSDLTDESLYRDCAGVNSANVVDSDDENDEVEESPPAESTGLLLTEEKKLARKGLPQKKVRFSTSPPRVRTMHVWLYAARQARAGNWRQSAADNERFKRRIADVDMAISWVLKPQHRARVKFQRFMPLWHAQRRQEEAERKVASEKLRIEEEALRIEEERLRVEEELRKEEEERLEEERRLREAETKVPGADEASADSATDSKDNRKCKKKKISTKQFANNVGEYLAKMKKENQKSEGDGVKVGVRVNGLAEIKENAS